MYMAAGASITAGTHSIIYYYHITSLISTSTQKLAPDLDPLISPKWVKVVGRKRVSILINPNLNLYCCHCIIIIADLKTVSLAVAGVDLSDHLVEVVITLFDEDGE